MNDKIFIKKRILEQKEYIVKIIKSDLPIQRKLEIIISAAHQLSYFQSKLDNQSWQKQSQ